MGLASTSRMRILQLHLGWMWRAFLDCFPSQGTYDRVVLSREYSSGRVEEPAIQLVGEACDYQGLLAMLGEVSPDVVVMDVHTRTAYRKKPTHRAPKSLYFDGDPAAR
jgi:hypothetical protein